MLFPEVQRVAGHNLQLWRLQYPHDGITNISHLPKLISSPVLYLITLIVSTYGPFSHLTRTKHSFTVARRTRSLAHLTSGYKLSSRMLRFEMVFSVNPLRPNSDLSQTSHCNIKGLSVRELMRIENMITQVKFS